jgi:hypothetical protein
MKNVPLGPIALLVSGVVVFLSCTLPGCYDPGKTSMDHAKVHAAYLLETIAEDVEEVRRGLPQGADVLAAEWKAEPELGTDPKAARDALEKARGKVQDLRIAKSTFFAIATPDGIVVRNDQEQDRMAGRPLFPSFPALAEATSRYVDTIGSMPEASGVRTRPDGQWVAGAPVRVEGATKGIFVTGWSWASYAYRLEFGLRSKIKSEIAGNRDLKEPLVYVFLVLGKSVYGAPVSPEVNAKAIANLDPIAKTREDQPYTERLEITGRVFGLAVRRTPAFGAEAAVAVLRSET